MNRKIELGAVVLKPVGDTLDNWCYSDADFVNQQDFDTQIDTQNDTAPLLQNCKPLHKGENFTVLRASTIRLK